MPNNTGQNLIIDVKSVFKRYDALQALVDVSFSVQTGEIIALLGPNGAGKTTMMKVLTGFMEPTSGEVFVDGVDIQKDRLSAQKQIGYLPENAPIYADMLVQEYLCFAAKLRGISSEELLDRVSEAVFATSLEDVLTRPIGELSKGFRQRVGLAQAILHKPKLLILDEPTNGLDPNQILEIRALIKKLSEHATVLLSTHILSEAEATCDRAIIMIQGRIRADAGLKDLGGTSRVLLSLSKENSAVQPHTVIKHLDELPVVSAVSFQQTDGLYEFRIEGKGSHISSHKLSKSIFEVARTQGWPVCELYSEQKTLEAVFRELAGL